MSTQALPVEVQADDRAEHQRADDCVQDAILDALGINGISDHDSQRDHPEKRDELADAVNHSWMARKQVFFVFERLRCGKCPKVGIAETALESYRLDGLSADRASLFVCFHDRSVRDRIITQKRLTRNSSTVNRTVAIPVFTPL